MSIPRPSHSLLHSMLVLAASAGLALCLPISSSATQNSATLVFEEAPLPEVLFLCGEPVPLERWEVREMLDRELSISMWNQAQVFMWLKRAGRYFPYIEKRLKEEGLPDDLKYLAVAESALIMDIRSSRGAMGPWQFMPATARQIGLRYDNMIDERRDFERSTTAAFQYLRRLHDIFGNWALAMAAYNCGKSRLRDQMKRQKADSFYRLSLPLETERYIYRIAAIKLILENPGGYGYRIPPSRVYRPIPCDRVEVNSRGVVPMVEVAEVIGADVKMIKDLNPHILGYNMPPGRYVVNVPTGQGPLMARAVEKMSRTYAGTGGGPITGDLYIVQRGDTLSSISKRSGVPVATIRSINGIQGSLIRIGQQLRLRP